MDIIFNHFTPVLMQVFSRLRVVLKSQKGPDASTRAALLERVQTGRVIRRHAYDLYLPPKENNAEKSEHNITSLLFFPGFGICHSAYADVASRLSDCGIPVAVVSLEPLRLAHKAVCGGMDDVMRLIKSAGNEVVHYYKHNIYKESANIDDNIIVEWALGGHSMGGYNALQLADELLIQTNPPSVILPDGSISRVGSQIVAWAAGNMIEAVPDLQGKGSSPLRVLIVFASNDDIAKFTSQEQKQQLLSKLPKTRASRLETIKGGTHSGFASYSKCSMRAQQKEASMLTARFLLDK